MVDEMAWSYLVGAIGAAHALDQQELRRRTLAASREVPLPGSRRQDFMSGTCSAARSPTPPGSGPRRMRN